MEDNQILPERFFLSGNIGKIQEEWSTDITIIETDDIALPCLWARARIRELEESETVTVGSQQLHRKESEVKKAIIDISQEYGIISRETSFVAVEKRLDTEKTTGEVILRKVPVMLTAGWEGLREERQNLRAVVSLQPSPLSPSVVTRNSQLFMRHPRKLARKQTKQVAGVDNNLEKEVAEPKPSTMEDGLLNILALQKANGGFEIDATLAQNLKVSLSDLRSQADKIQAKGKPEKFTLLSTAIILKYLEYRYADHKASWEAIVQKSQRWLDDQILKTEPMIEGIKLIDWVDRFIRELGPAASG